MGVRLSDDELWELLRTAHTGILTTLRRDGVPISLPMWFVALDRAVYLRTLARARKMARIRRDPRVGFLVESGLRWAELKAAHLTGHAEIVGDAEVEARVAQALDVKYSAYRTSRERQPEATRAHYGGEWVTVRIVPEGRVLSWDNAKLRLKAAP
ncbi:MAG TPA: pyridoxamine 5'-phosphate oxidase family protein [Candidatus Bathyarchaeia archaeon]|nr:pyridoxamine 5'-phosphate oxidase family protein [Candidatus Bathyarchaeia archaeon]